MGQMSWRVDDELLERVRQAAREHGWSLNLYVTKVLDAASDPDNAPSGTERLRERLARAGLLADSGPSAERPPRSAVRRAAKAAGRGTAVSDVVASERG
ncbi:MAG TPA: toxin-antitoxin system HicB family antitoxin [Kribbellaceae bacterium]|nr:toxin-antitoxin system HicB family antitoxin [Kribbellaceae bacterium]